MKYNINIVKTYIYTEEIEADSYEEAEDLAYNVLYETDFDQYQWMGDDIIVKEVKTNEGDKSNL